MPKRAYVCQNPDCQRVFTRYGKTHKTKPKYCSPSCNATMSRPSDRVRIPDGAPMSRATQARRKKAAQPDKSPGLT